MPRFKDQAICIRLLDWSETSQIVALLTQNHGKVRGLAKGAKRMSPGAIARFSGGIELLTQGQVLASTKATSDLATLTEWDLQQPHAHLRSDLQSLNLALYAADLASALVPELQPQPRSYEALARLLSALRMSEARPAALLQFQWDVLDDCGYKPELEHDVETGSPLSGSAIWFDATAGGLRTSEPAQASELAGPWRVRSETVALLQHLAHGGLAQDETRDLATLERANRLLCVYIRALLDRQLPTMAFVLGQ